MAGHNQRDPDNGQRRPGRGGPNPLGPLAPATPPPHTDVEPVQPVRAHGRYHHYHHRGRARPTPVQVEQYVPKVPVFLTGATGYIGGTVLHDLLRSDLAPRLSISALVRTEEQAKQLKKWTRGSVIPVVGTLEDLRILQREAGESDVVIHTAHADHVPAAKAIIQGLKNRAERRKQTGILIHTSGTDILADQAGGNYVNPHVYLDTAIDEIRSLGPEQPHREVDMIIEAAGASGDVESYIIMPPTVYGKGKGSFITTSLQVPMLIRDAIRSGVTHVVGKGLPLWNHVHIDDLSSLYLLILRQALEASHPAFFPVNLTHSSSSTASPLAPSELPDPPPTPPNGTEGYYFSETGERSWLQTSQCIAETMHAMGYLKTADVVSWKTLEEAARGLGLPDELAWVANVSHGCNARSRCPRARSIGWQPERDSDDFFKSMPEEVEHVIKTEHLV